jgi:hypothetical protein
MVKRSQTLKKMSLPGTITYPSIKRSRDWTCVFSRCANCGHEIHRNRGRHKPWLHANASPWCRFPFDHRFETFSPTSLSTPVHQAGSPNLGSSERPDHEVLTSR